jgi:hypothetical protein
LPRPWHYQHWGNANQKDDAGQRRHEEERMTIDIAMWAIAISVPALIYAGCIMTSKKKKAPDLPVAAPYELDRAA